MPFPDVDPLIETFFEPTRIFLFGKQFAGLIYDPAPMRDPRPGQAEAEWSTYPPDALDKLGMPPSRLERTLRRLGSEEAQSGFARIYSFSFEGHYYKLPRPQLFLVAGPGANPQQVADGAMQFNTRRVGLEGKDWHFSEDIRVWAVDKKDLAICLDMEIGNYEQLLLESMMAFEEEMSSRGAASARGAVSARGAASARGAVSARGAASFRGAMVGPHQER
jgi:hypothetical protein